MDRGTEKILEKVKKLRLKDQLQKARSALEEIPLIQRGELAVFQETIILSLQLDSWSEILVLIKQGLNLHSFRELLGGNNREALIKKVNEIPSFMVGLLDLVCQLRTLDGIIDWLHLCEPVDQRYLAQTWVKMGNDILDPHRAALIQMAAGVALLICGDETAAFQAWSDSLANDPRLLKRIMTWCQSLDSEKEKNVHQRLRLIKLVAAAGKVNESLTLLKALGNESDENALKVHNDLPDLMGNHFKSKEVLGLRYSLGLKLADPELIHAIVADMDTLSEDDLFPFKKLAIHQITDPKLRLAVLLDFVRLYIRQENWENAAPLLQMLYEESPQPNVVELMEQVLDRFPIISSLRFILGKHYLERDNSVLGMQHLNTITQIPEYEAQIIQFLENRLAIQYDSEIARVLVNLLPLRGNKSGLVALLMSIQDPRVFVAALSDWGDPHMSEQESPFWDLALARAFLGIGRYEQAYPFLWQLIKRFPDMAPEAVRLVEKLVNTHQRDYTELILAIDHVADRIEPRRAWSALRNHLVAITRTVKANPAVRPEPTKSAPLPPSPAPAPAPVPVPVPARVVVPAEPIMETVHDEPVSYGVQAQPMANLPPEFQAFRGHLEANNFRAAAEVAEKTVAAAPQSILFVLNQLERLCREQPREVIWPTTILRILIASASFEKATETGRRIIANYNFQAEMPQIYQLLARAYEGMGDLGEALRFYCLSSRQARFYYQNRERLLQMVLPNHPQFIKEVVQLALNNEDMDLWDELLKAWFKTRPEDLDAIIRAQETFAQKVGLPRALLDLTFWYLQAGRLHDIDDTLNRIDLQDPEILDYLTHIAHLAHMKYPDDPKPKFLLGKYYLIQQDSAKAVETFRNLARQIPESAETIYHFLRTYLKKNVNSSELVTLYGLLIRFALDHGSPVASVRLLEELGRIDRPGAASLVGGVYRVIVQKEERLEAMYELMHLAFQWKDYERLLEVSEHGGFGDHMVAERLEWLHKVAEEANFRDRALLAVAQAYFDSFDFSRCREFLRRIEHSQARRKALGLYEKLADRFPEQLDIWREGGWAAFPQEPKKAQRFFERVFQSEFPDDCLEAYAMLKELGANPSFARLTTLIDNPNEIYTQLLKIHEQIRQMELAYWETTDQPTPRNTLAWLISSHRLERFRENLAGHEELGEAEIHLLEANAYIAQGQLTQAAWHLSRAPVPSEITMSLFHNANLTEQAVLLKKPGTRLPLFLHEAFESSFHKPAIIAANVTHLRNCRRHHQLQPIAEVKDDDPGNA